MKIKRLFINNYKSLVDFELVEPNPFSVFVGPNAAGKSNVFEALEFLSFVNDFVRSHDLFGGAINFVAKHEVKKLEKGRIDSLGLEINLEIEFLQFGFDTPLSAALRYVKIDDKILPGVRHVGAQWGDSHENWRKNIEAKEEAFYKIYTRLFVRNYDLVKLKTNGSDKLRIDAANLEPVLHRILQNETKQEEISDWLQMLIPELDRVEVAKSDLSGDFFLRIFEKHLDEPIGKNLISDGTYNILALLTAVYQSDEPQFLCIEEPENGLNPYVIRELVGFFRQMCEEKGHYIWLNTHSATLVKELQPKELILINKIDGITKAKQLDPNLQFKSMPLDEAWLTNTLGGGLPW